MEVETEMIMETVNLDGVDLVVLVSSLSHTIQTK